MSGDGEDWNGLEMTILKSLAVFFKIHERWRSSVKELVADCTLFLTKYMYLIEFSCSMLVVMSTLTNFTACSLISASAPISTLVLTISFPTPMSVLELVLRFSFYRYVYPKNSSSYIPYNFPWRKKGNGCFLLLPCISFEIAGFQACHWNQWNTLTILNEHNIVKNPNWMEADQLAIYKAWGSLIWNHRKQEILNPFILSEIIRASRCEIVKGKINY